MLYGICNIGIAPLRIDPSDKSEMVSQLLYGEHFMVLKTDKKWSYIRNAFDDYEGWVDNNQYQDLSYEVFHSLERSEKEYAYNLLEVVTDDKDSGYMSVPMGSVVSSAHAIKHLFIKSTEEKPHGVVDVALTYLNAPYLWGGKTPFGIDCSGFVQMVYRLNGVKLYRDTSEQVNQGTPLSFIEESRPGDIAFFGDAKISHVGILLEDHHIIHAHGKVRIDKIDQSGIFNVDTKKHTHNLKVIKRI